MKRERLDFRVGNALHTRRFSPYMGRRCRSGTIRDVAGELHLDWQMVKRLEMAHMREQIRRVGTPDPKVIRIDEISIRKGHSYRIVVNDLERRRPIWFGGDDRSGARMDQFYRFLRKKWSKRTQLAVMDRWKTFRKFANRNAPQAAILFDKFHVMKHLGGALDKIRKAEYARLEGKQRRFIEGQQYTFLSHPQNLTGPARRNLKLLLAANKRLNTADLLKEYSGPLWDDNREAWRRKFFDNWRAGLKWQCVKPYEKSGETIERHRDGIAAYCQPENTVALGFVEGLNNKIRVMQRRVYGLRNEHYLRLKVLTSMPPQI